ncbi:MAG: sulfite exporter TauE/SafE family protein [Burkholderiales bacterium]|nr:sulfite exporter TauE/SafE family protein [Burkholderiales bacterium]
MDLAAVLHAELALALGREPTALVLAAVAGAFVAGGLVKGLLGVGLPLVIVPLLALVIPSPKAIALMGIPIVLSNVWQAADSGHVVYAIKRFATLLVTLAIATAVTARLALGLPVATLNAMVACALLLAVVLMAWHPQLDIDTRAERRWGAAVGTLSGMMGGVSSLMGPLLITYLVGVLPLMGAMVSLDVLGVPEAVVSCLALAPLFAGMALGKRLRSRVGEAAFRLLLLVFLTAVAVLLLTR